MAVIGMTKISKLFNKFLAALKKLKEAKSKMAIGEMSVEEFFDTEYYSHETEQAFIKELSKNEKKD